MRNNEDDFISGRRNIKDLLPEAIAFTLEILTDLARTPIVSHTQRYSKITSRPTFNNIHMADVTCYEDYDLWKQESASKSGLELSLNRAPYECSNPYIRESFRKTIEILLAERGYHKPPSAEYGYQHMKHGDYAAGGIESLCSITAYGIAFHAPKETVEATLIDLAHTDLTNACLKGLRLSLNEMRNFLDSSYARSQHIPPQDLTH